MNKNISLIRLMTSILISSFLCIPLASNALSPIKPTVSKKIKASITLSAKTVKQGQKIKATLKGFAPNSQLTITIDTQTILSPYSFYSDKKGTGTLTFMIPKALPNGSYPLFGVDAYNTIAETKILVKGKQAPITLSIDPTQGVAGTTVTLSGNGWLSKRPKTVSLKGYNDNGEEVLMDFDPESVEDFCTNQSCGETEAKVRVQIPEDAQVPEDSDSGIYELVFSDGYNQKTIEFTLVNPQVQEDKESASIGLGLSQLSVGDPLVISGVGFTPKSGLIVKIGDTTYSIKRGPSLTDDQGAFSGAVIDTSSLPEGAYTVTVMDGLGNSDKESFTIRKVQFGDDPVGGGPEIKPVLPPTDTKKDDTKKDEQKKETSIQPIDPKLCSPDLPLTWRIANGCSTDSKPIVDQPTTEQKPEVKPEPKPEPKLNDPVLCSPDLPLTWRIARGCAT